MTEQTPVADAAGEPLPVQLEEITIPMPFVVFAVPSATGWCSMQHRDSCIQLTELLQAKGVPHAFIGTGGKLYLDLVRDTLATQFLEDFPDATDLFFIDDDVGFPAEAVLQFLVRPEPVLTGAYPKKTILEGGGLDFPVRLLGEDKGDGRPVLIENNGLMRVDRMGGGFLRIKRGVLEHLVEHGKLARYRDEDSKRLLWHFFSAGVLEIDGEWTYCGEDTVFALRCISNGFDLWLEPNINFTHSGRWTFHGNCLRELLRRGGLQGPEGIRPNIERIEGDRAVLSAPAPIQGGDQVGVMAEASADAGETGPSTADAGGATEAAGAREGRPAPEQPEIETAPQAAAAGGSPSRLEGEAA